MFFNYRRLFVLVAVAATTTSALQCAVDSIAGDTGSAQSGSIILSGGSTGLHFDSSTTSHITANMNFLSLPNASTTAGYVDMGGQVAIHQFPANSNNFFVGSAAGNFTMSTANSNAGFGFGALNSLDSGSQNCAVGYAALVSLASGSNNIGIGYLVGSALASGSGNVLVGNSAGANYASNETGNIILGANSGVADEVYTIRIGDGQIQQNCYIDGIYQSPIDIETALDVLVDSSGKLGVDTRVVSIVTRPVDILPSSKLIMNLSPEGYILKNNKKSFGLNPAEVVKVLPSLVVSNKKGDPFAVKYRDLQILMLDQQQRQESRIAKLEKTIQKLLDRVAALENALACKE